MSLPLKKPVKPKGVPEVGRATQAEKIKGDTSKVVVKALAERYINDCKRTGDIVGVVKGYLALGMPELASANVAIAMKTRPKEFVLKNKDAIIECIARIRLKSQEHAERLSNLLREKLG